MKKRILTLLLAGLLAVSVVACNKPEENPNTTGSSDAGSTYITDSDGNRIVNETVYSLTNNLNLRNEASTTGEAAAKVDFGTVMTRLKAGDVWSLVEYEGEQYYVMSEYITTDDLAGSTFTTCNKEMHTTTDANVRKYPTINSYVENNVVKTLIKGTTVTVVGENDTWYKIAMDGKHYYISASVLDDGTIPSINDIEGYESKFANNNLLENAPKTMYVTASLRIREYPSAVDAYSTVLGSLKAGDSVEVYSVARMNDGKKWAQIKILVDPADPASAKKPAYISFDYLSETKVGNNKELDSLLEAYTPYFKEVDDITMWVPKSINSVNVRTSPYAPEGDVSNRYKSLKSEEEVTVIALGEDKFADWCIVSLGEEGFYFVNIEYLTTDESKEAMLTKNSALKFSGIQECEPVEKSVKSNGAYYYIKPELTSTYLRGEKIAADTKLTVVAKGTYKSFDVYLVKVGANYWFIDQNNVQ